MQRVIERTYMTASDGVKLYTVVVRPDEAGRYPAILVRNPYVNAPTDAEAKALLKHFNMPFNS